MQELWRPVVGYEHRYVVSNLGRVRRLAYSATAFDRRLQRNMTRHHKSKLLRLTPDKAGYLKVRIGQETRLVHQLVLFAFVGPRPDGCVACHGPAGIADNSLGNLSWGSLSKNMGDDRRRDNTLPCGETHYLAKLTVEKVKYIRKHYNEHKNCARLADLLGISSATVHSVVTGKTWKHVN